MTTQQLIYETAVPVSSGRHGKCSVEAGDSYAFSKQVNSVPLMAVEFPQAAVEYAVVFADSGDGSVVPVVILGARKNENLFLDAEGRWQGRYIPAFVRRYPFIFATQDDGKTFTLCVDEAYPGLNYLGRGQALFGADGKPAPYTDEVMKFLQEYRVQFMRTQAFAAKLKDLDLLEPMQAEFTLGSGEKTSLTGFRVIDRKKLKALSGEQLSALAQTDELELIYLHLQSMRNFNAVKDRLVAVAGSAGASQPAAAAGGAGGANPPAAAAHTAEQAPTTIDTPVDAPVQ